MILPFKKFFDKEKKKPTYFAEKIMRMAALNIGIHEIHEFYNKNRYPFNKKIFNNSSQKIHTIREDKKNRWKAGNKIHAVYNNRQKNQFQFAPTFECVSIQRISIKYPTQNSYPFVWIETIPCGSNTVKKIALNDGFDTVADFFSYFNNDFEGKIIHFTNFRY